MILRKKLKAILPVCLCTCALVLAGCADDGNNTSGTSGVTAEAEESTAEAKQTEQAEISGKQEIKEAGASEEEEAKAQEASEKKESEAEPSPTATPTAAPTPAVSEEPEEQKPEETEQTEAGTDQPDNAEAEPPSDGTDPAEGTEGSGTEETGGEEQPPEEPVPEEPADIPLPETETVMLDPSWEFADSSAINSGAATLYYAQGDRKGVVVGVNAGHGTEGGSSVYTYCHPDRTPKVTGGTTGEGAIEAMAVSTGMEFYDGTPERDVTLREAQILKDLLLANGYDVLMIRDGYDVQLDNVARTVICNNRANCHIAIHWDGDGLDYDKGCYYMSVPDGIKGMYPTSTIWEEDNRLGECLIAGLTNAGCPIMSGGSMPMDLTQTSYSTIPSVDIELGNKASDHSDEALSQRAQGLLSGINMFFGF